MVPAGVYISENTQQLTVSSPCGLERRNQQAHKLATGPSIPVLRPTKRWIRRTSAWPWPWRAHAPYQVLQSETHTQQHTTSFTNSSANDTKNLIACTNSSVADDSNGLRTNGETFSAPAFTLASSQFSQ